MERGGVQLRSCGGSALKVSELGVGCWQLGGRGWGRVSQRDVVAALVLACERGVNLFDTAAVYGFGVSETLLGQALKQFRTAAVVVSKGGLVWDWRRRVRHDASPESLRQQLEASLVRLGRDHIDLYLLHWPDAQTPLEASVEALDGFVDAGLIRAWGVSNHSDDLVAQAVTAATPRPGAAAPVIELPLNALDFYPRAYRTSAAAGAELMRLAVAHGLGVIAFDVLARGYLARPEVSSPGRRDVRREDERFCAPPLHQTVQRARFFELAAALGVAPAALAVRATLSRPGVSSALVGVKSTQQLEECLGYSEVELPSELRSGVLERPED